MIIMKVSNLFGKGHLVEKTNRNAFPLDATRSFTAPFGALLPIDCMEVPANSYVELHNEMQTIMTPIIRPPFGLLKQHIDYFAVPMVQLYQPFDNFVTGQNNFDSSAVARNNKRLLPGADETPWAPNEVPMISQQSLLSCLHELQFSNNYDVFNFKHSYNACRLLDLLGYGNYYKLVQDEDIMANLINNNNFIPPVNLFNLLAYQKIYYSYYSNSNYEHKDNYAFNIDDLAPGVYDTNYNDGASDESGKFSFSRLKKMLTLHYRWQNKDYFTQVMPSILPTGLGFQVQQPTSNGSVPSTADNVWSLFSIPGAKRAGIDADPDEVNVPQNQGQYVESDGTFVPSIRLAFAFDKLLRRMRQAGSSFNSQMLAQFGIKPIDYRHGDVIYLGGYTNQLRFDEVTSTSETADASIGALGGKLTAYNNNARTIKYSAREDCIIMCIYSTSLDMQYHSFNLDRQNLRRFRFDWFNPAFENLGLQALYACEYNMLDTGQQPGTSQMYLPSNLSTQQSIMGFIKRYSEYKTRPNKVHGLLQWPYDNADAQAWVIQKHDVYYDSSSEMQVKQQQFVPFAMPNMLQNPLFLNSVTQVKYDGSWETDHFNCFALCGMKLVANMSVQGEVF